jgi:hypothetical protein
MRIAASRGRTTHAGIGVERDFRAATVGARLPSTTDDQSSVFGTRRSSRSPSSTLLRRDRGDVSATGRAVGVRTNVTSRVKASVEYVIADAWLSPADDLRYLLVMTPTDVATRARRIHSVDAAVETTVPETATRLVIFYRISDGFAQGSNLSDHALSNSGS